MENEAGATLTVSNSTFTGDLALGGTGGGIAFGGTIENEAGTVTILHSTFKGNQALGGAGLFGGIAASGGLSVGSHGSSERKVYFVLQSYLQFAVPIVFASL